VTPKKVAVRHVHIMVLDIAGEKELLLGACFRSHVCVVLCSDLNIRVVEVIVSLRCKFQGVYTQKQLIGSKKCASIIQACLPILLPTPVTLHRF
jgi:hypothetical protein